MTNPLLLSLVIITFILGLSTGFTLSPEYQEKMQSRGVQMVELGKADQFVDLRYIDNMIAHHLNAIYMANQAKTNSQRPEIVALANDIIKADEAGIKTLYEQKKSWYKNEKQITKFEKINLGAYDETFDLRFLNALIAHHDGAVESAQEIRTKSQRNEILNLADTVIQSLSASKAKLIEWRKNWYNI